MKYTKKDFLKAAKLGEVSMIDAKHIVSLLDEVVELPQQEISDEEIEKAAEEFYPTDDIYREMWAENRCWQMGAKWYREQLKSKNL